MRDESWTSLDVFWIPVYETGEGIVLTMSMVPRRYRVPATRTGFHHAQRLFMVLPHHPYAIWPGPQSPPQTTYPVSYCSKNYKLCAWNTVTEEHSLSEAGLEAESEPEPRPSHGPDVSR